MNAPLKPFALGLAALLLAGITALGAPALAPNPGKAGTQALVGAVWVDPVGSFYRDTPRIDRFISDLRARPFGEAVIQVVQHQSAFYASKLLPRVIGVPERFDPLLVLVKGLRTQPGGLKLVAWVNPYGAGNINSATPLAPQHVATTHPDWLSQRADGNKADASGDIFLEPGLPEVQRHLEQVVRELVNNYPIDGIYFDLVGDPGEDWGYHPRVVADWQQKTGNQDKPQPQDPTWIAFRAGLISTALDGLARAARAERGSIMVGVAGRTDGPPPASATAFHQSPVYTHFHQDWPAWLTTAKPVNRLYLQDFKSEEEEKGAFEGWLHFALQATKPTRTQLIVGVDGSLNESIQALAQLRKAAEAGARGVALADYEKPVRDGEAEEPFLNAVRNTVLSPEYMATFASTRGHSIEELASTSATQAAQPAPEDLALPPPPSPLTPEAPTPDDVTARRPAAGEHAATNEEPLTGENEVTVRHQRSIIPGTPEEAGMTTMTLNTTPAPNGALTRRQMLDELINDPQFTQAPDWTLIRPGEKYKNYLKERFGNIFE